MNIDWNEEEVDFLKTVLTEVDKKAIDPQFSNLIPRMVLGDDGVNLEHSEIHIVIEALNDFSDENYMRFVSEEDRNKASEYLNKIEGMGFVI